VTSETETLSTTGLPAGLKPPLEGRYWNIEGLLGARESGAGANLGAIFTGGLRPKLVAREDSTVVSMGEDVTRDFDLSWTKFAGLKIEVACWDRVLTSRCQFGIFLLPR